MGQGELSERKIRYQIVARHGGERTENGAGSVHAPLEVITDQNPK